MSDEAGRYTAEHTVMVKDMEIRELKQLVEAKDKKIKELEKEIVQLKSPDYPKDDVAKTVTLTNGTKVIGGYLVDDVDYAVADDGKSYDNRGKMSGDNPTGELDESEDEFTEQLSFSFNQE